MNIKASSQFGMSKKHTSSHAFTIVELLVVIVVIGILAAITIVSYAGITQKATVASLNSDLDNASKLLRMFNVSNSTYPTTISTNCTTNPDTVTNKCLSFSSGTTYNYKVSPTDNRIFCLDVTKSSVSYNVTQEGQLLAGPCPILNLDAGNTLSYVGTGTTWKDLSGNDNNGTLNNGVAYSNLNGGAMNFDGVDDNVTTPVSVPTGRSVTIDVIGKVTSTAVSNNFFSANAPAFIRVVGGKVRWNIYVTKDSDSTDAWTFTNGNATISPNTIYNLTMTYDGAFQKGYINGVSDINVAIAGQVPYSSLIKLGYTTGGEDSPLLGSIYSTKVYNKALSASEIKQNFDSIKGRYGL